MNIPNVSEHSAVALFTKEYGDNIITRYNKLKEELQELDEVFNECFITGIMTPDLHKHLLDKLSDVQGTFTHFASLFSLYQKEMLYNCIDKVTTRKTNPEYKRFDNFGFINRLKTSIIPVPEFDETKAYPKAIKKDNTYYMPDPKFYYNEIQIQDAWKRYFLGEGCKMVKCNEQGIQTGNDNEHE